MVFTMYIIPNKIIERTSLSYASVLYIYIFCDRVSSGPLHILFQK